MNKPALRSPNGLPLLLGLLLLLPAFRGWGQEAPPAKVALQLQWKHQFEFAGHYAAIQQGFYAKRGLEVELREYREGMDPVEEVLSGRAQYGIFHSGIIQARLEGKPVKLLANYFKRMPLVILARPPIRTLAELRGKRLMAGAKDTGSPLVLKAFESEGLRPGVDVEFVPHTFDAGPFQRGEVDAMTAFATNEPFYLEQDGIPFNIIDLADYMPSLGEEYLFTSESQAADHPEATRAFIEATNEGWRYALDHPEAIVDLILTDYSQRKGRDALLYEAQKTKQMIRPLPLPIGAVFGSLIDEVAELILRQQGKPDQGRLKGFLFDRDGGPFPPIELTTEERGWIEEHPRIVLGMTDQFAPALIRNEDGSLAGILVDYLDIINRRLGTHIGLAVESSWQAAGEAAVAGKTDGLAVAAKASAWAPHFLLTHPYLEVDTYLYIANNGVLPGTAIDELAGKRVGYLKGTKRIEQLLRTRPAIDAVALENNRAIANALTQGQVDLVIGDASVEYWRKQHLQAAFKVGGLLDQGQSEVHFAIRKDWPILVDLLNKALSGVSAQEHARILDRWLGTIGPATRKKAGVALRPNERAWLRQHPNLRYCYSPIWRPYDYREGDRHQGMFADYLGLFAQELGIELVPVPTPTWDDALELARTRGCDLVSGAVATPQRRAYLAFTRPYFEVANVLIAKPDKPFVSGLESLPGKRLGVLPGSAMSDLLRRDYPGLELASAPTEGLIEMLDRGEIYAAVMSLEHAAAYVEEGLYNYKIIGKLDTPYPISVAVRNDWPELHAIMDQAVAALSPAEHNDIRRKWTHHTLREQVDYTLLGSVLLGGGLMLAAFAYWNRRLRREVRRRIQVETALSLAKAEAEEALRARNILLDNALVAITLVVERRFTWVNDHALKLFGYSREEVLSRSTEHLYTDPADFRRVGVEAPPVLTQGNSYQGEFRFRCKDGRHLWCMISGKAVDPADLRKGIIYIVIDIDERKRADAALIAAKEAAEAANRAKSAFLANMSHELRTPLNAMLGHAQILQRDASLGEDQRRSVETIRRSGDHLITLINDILDLAKIEAGRLELTPAPCDLHALLHGLEELFQLHARDKGIAFRYLERSPLPMVTADDKRLRQIVMNLLGNAVKFTEKGEVRLEASYTATPSADSPRDCCGWLTLDVADTGIGISPERIDGLFRPFQQEGSAAYRNQGTGLGLAIVKQLTEQMGGGIEVESTLGRGSRFNLRLPLPALPRPSAAASPTPARAPIGYRRRNGCDAPLRILAVDDLADNREVLRGLLVPIGFAVDEATDGSSALSAAAEQRPDLVLMDLVMPGMNGVEATRRLLALPGCEALPVIACSASAFAEDRTNSAAAGCVDHLAKPVRSEELFAALERHLGLEWVVEGGGEPPPDGTDGRTLPPEQLAELLQLTRRGDIAAIRKRLGALPATAGIVPGLREAAGRFDLKALRRLLEER